LATLHPKTSRGNKYWYIVESRRVNGKPRPVVLAYLGKAENLLARLSGLRENLKVKSYSHGAVAALLDVAQKLEVPSVINKHVKSQRPYMANKPTRNDLTVGMTILLGAIGRVCMPTSKRGWRNWAKTTSCEYMLRCSLAKIDSQHFWDLMDALPVDAIEKIEAELLGKVLERYPMDADTLFFDTTNFFTYVATDNQRCTLAQRGKNKQKRNDLRQVGLAMVVTRKDFIPLFHLTYQGNRHDSKVFAGVLFRIKKRMEDLGLDLEAHTLVFDRGNNSKQNLALVAEAKLHYVGALTPCHHRELLKKAARNFKPALINGEQINVYRGKHRVWGEQRTILIFVSRKLKDGQLRGIYGGLKKKLDQLEEIQRGLAGAKKKRSRAALETRIGKLLTGQFIGGVIEWDLKELSAGSFRLRYWINETRFAEMEDDLGVRILMSDRHDWETEQIIAAYHGQSFVEQAFKNLKNPYHLALKPGFHWTDQKIMVHYFMCVLGYLLASIVWREAREKAGFEGTLDSLLDLLDNVRLAALIEQPKGRGRPKVNYQLEQTSKEETALVDALGIAELHSKRPRFSGVGVYK
jgi:transposase